MLELNTVKRKICLQKIKPETTEPIFEKAFSVSQLINRVPKQTAWYLFSERMQL